MRPLMKSKTCFCLLVSVITLSVSCRLSFDLLSILVFLLGGVNKKMRRASLEHPRHKGWSFVDPRESPCYSAHPLMRRGGRLAQLLYPPACLLCHARLDPSRLCSGEDTGDERVVCQECLRAATPNAPPVCSRCGVGLPGAFDAVMACRVCQRAPFAFDMARAPWRYTGPIRETVHQFKYARRWRLGSWLASQMTRTAQDAFPLEEVTLVLSVPPFWLKHRLKGFDPSQELGRAVA